MGCIVRKFEHVERGGGVPKFEYVWEGIPIKTCLGGVPM